MKKLIFPIIGILMATGFFACKKDASTGKTSLDVSKLDKIAKGEPVEFTLGQAAAGASVNWSVSPNVSTQINSTGNKAIIRFGAKGYYTVTAVGAGLSASSTVSVTDSVYNPGVPGSQGTTQALLANEIIKITVSRNDSGQASYGLVFKAETSNAYPCASNTLLSTITPGTSSYAISFTGVFVPADCTAGGNAKAVAFTGLNYIQSGSTPLSITVNGKTYTGTIVKTGNNFTINWPNSTGVTISPTSL